MNDPLSLSESLAIIGDLVLHMAGMGFITVTVIAMIQGKPIWAITFLCWAILANVMILT